MLGNATISNNSTRRTRRGTTTPAMVAVAAAAMVWVALVLDRSCGGGGGLVVAAQRIGAGGSSSSSRSAAGNLRRTGAVDATIADPTDDAVVLLEEPHGTLQMATATAQRTTEAPVDIDGDDESIPSTPVRVACVGDSITHGECNASTYPAVLQERLGPDYAVTNYGKSGSSMMKGGECISRDSSFTWGCSYWDADEFRGALAGDPEIVLIMLGTNDAQGHNWYGPANGVPVGAGTGFREDYEAMIDAFRALPSAPRIILGIPPPAVPPPLHPNYPVRFHVDPEVANTILPPLVLSVSDSYPDVETVDVWTSLGGTDGYASHEMTCDGIHPSPRANGIIAAAFAGAIAPQPKPPVPREKTKGGRGKTNRNHNNENANKKKKQRNKKQGGRGGGG